MPALGASRQVEVADLEGGACLWHQELPAWAGTAPAAHGRHLSPRGSVRLWGLPVRPSALHLRLQAQARRALGT